MEQQLSTTNKKKKSSLESEQQSSCFFCAMEDPNPDRRQSSLSSIFSAMPLIDDDPSQVLIMSGLWSHAMTRPEDPTLPSSGILRCASLLIMKSLSNPSWLRRHQNIFIPYYCAHILGSFTLRLPSFASLAVSSGCLPPLLSLLRGAMSWIEQRAAVRALAHLASFDHTFPALAPRGHDTIIPCAVRLASTCLQTVSSHHPRIKNYQRDLLTRGGARPDLQPTKAEEWASQLQIWSLYLLCCFARRGVRWHETILNSDDKNGSFMKKLGDMWGGLPNGDSPGGVGLMRILCRSGIGRTAIAGCAEAVRSLCNLSRSSDDWQYMGIECLLLLVNDPLTRGEVFPLASPCLTDLAELRRLGSRVFGEKIRSALFLNETEEEEEEEMEMRWRKARERKREGNERFRIGDVEGAAEKYTEALMTCPREKRKERMVIYGKRATCRVVIGEADAAISDATRALALAEPANSHGKSLWGRAQAYDMKGMGKESLMDCLMFLNWWFGDYAGRRQKRVHAPPPYCVVRMIGKQVSRVWLFGGVKEKTGHVDVSSSSHGFGLEGKVEEILEMD